MSAPWTGDYAAADLLIIPTLGNVPIIATLAVHVATRKHWFRRSLDDGAVWSTPVLVADVSREQLTPEPLQLLLDRISGDIRAMSSYLSARYISQNGGASWSAY